MHDALDDNSHKHAVGVSKELKQSARRAIELIANEAVLYRREVLKKGVFDDPALAHKLTTDSVLYLFRLVFLFYVEARCGEIGIVPMQSEVYREGYSLEALRDLDLVPLTTELARNGHFLHESLDALFRIVNEGHGKPPKEDEALAADAMVLSGLRSMFFDQASLPILREVKLRNCVLQDVLRLLSLSEEKGRKQRGRISYANLGLNELGSVCEGILAYTGFFCEQDMVQVKAADKDKAEEGQGDERMFLVPKTRLGKYENAQVVRGEDGSPVTYKKGEYLFRLTGRDQKSSASYYTPKCLTECVVKYALLERLGYGIRKATGKVTPENAPNPIPADEMLNLTLCEPAMGFGAFLNEAIDQLAEAYLKKKQEELGQMIPHADYQAELRKVKYHLGVHNAYGVDLNPLAAKLGRLSIWLNILDQAALAPYLDSHLVAGNSLIGARRAVVSEELLASKKAYAWAEHAPDAYKLGTEGKERPKKSVYHFLLPDPGMMAFDSDEVIEKLEPEAVKRIRAWRSEQGRPLSEPDRRSLERISDRIDALWLEHAQQQGEVEEAIRQPVRIWGQPEPVDKRWKTWAECAEWQTRLQKGSSAGRRLRAVMSYWCSLWFWPLGASELLPSREEWLLEVETLLESDVDVLASRLARVELVQSLEERYRFHHWELAFAHVFLKRGGMDLIVGNPPWIQLKWREAGVLGDYEPRVAIQGLSAKQTQELRREVLENPRARDAYLAEAEDTQGAQGYLGQTSNYAILRGVKTNLYKCFLARSWLIGTKAAVFGMLHEPGLLNDAAGDILRGALYSRLRLIALFRNELVLFEAVRDTRPFAFSVGRCSSSAIVNFTLLANLFHPKTISDSLRGVGASAVPGIKDESTGTWDTRGHPLRCVSVRSQELELFAEVFDSPGTPVLAARLPAIHSSELTNVLEKFGKAPTKLGDRQSSLFSSQCFNETNQQKDNTIRRHTDFATTVEDVVLSGPHFYVATPFNRSARSECTHNSHYDVQDLTELPDDYLPRTNYVRACSPQEYEKRTPHWRGKPFTDFFRHVNRRMVVPGTERTLIPAIVPPGVRHIHTVWSITFDTNATLATFSALASSIVYDFFCKITGKSDILNDTLSRLPLPLESPYQPYLIARALRLNCLTTHYAPLWEELFDRVFRQDGFSKQDPRLPSWSKLPAKWDRGCALRTPFERRQALVELDALAALTLGITSEQIGLLYRVQFPVLQQYERDTFYDQRGMIVFTANKGLSGVGLDRKSFASIRDAKAGDKLPSFAKEYVPPFDRCDREDDLAQAHDHFRW